MGVGLNRILVPLDGSGAAEWALPMASAIARRADARLQLVLVHTPLAHVFPDVTAAGYLDGWETERVEQETEYLDDAAHRLREAGLDATAETTMGDAVRTLVDRADDADLVVITAHGWSGSDRAWLGHVADGVVHHVRAPVLVVRPDGADAPDSLDHDPGIHRILAATDGSPAAEAAVDRAADLARLFGARLTLFRSVSVPIGPSSPYIPHAAALDRETAAAWEREARSHLERRAQGIADLDVGTRLEHGYRAARAILDAAKDEDADLLAIGTHRESRLARIFLGSVADKVVRGIRAPVLIAHADRD